MRVSVRPLVRVERFSTLARRRGLRQLTALSFPLSTRVNLGKEPCRTQKSQLRVEIRATLTVRLKVWLGRLRSDRREAAGGHAAGHPEVEIGGSGGGRLGQHAGGGDPLRPRV